MVPWHPVLSQLWGCIVMVWPVFSSCPKASVSLPAWVKWLIEADFRYTEQYLQDSDHTLLLMFCSRLLVSLRTPVYSRTRLFSGPPYIINSLLFPRKNMTEGTADTLDSLFDSLITARIGLAQISKLLKPVPSNPTPECYRPGLGGELVTHFAYLSNVWNRAFGAYSLGPVKIRNPPFSIPVSISITDPFSSFPS